MLGEVVRYSKEWFLAKLKPLAFHCPCNHFKGLACTYFMGKQGVVAIKNVGNGIDLMFSELYLGVHAHKIDMAAIVLTGSYGVKTLVVELNKGLPPVGISENPILKSVLDKLLFLLCRFGFFYIEDTDFLSVRLCFGIVDTHITQIEGILKYLVGIGSGSTVGGIGSNIIIADGVLGCYAPFGGKL